MISASKFCKIISRWGKTQGASSIRVVERSLESFMETMVDYGQKSTWIRLFTEQQRCRRKAELCRGIGRPLLSRDVRSKTVTAGFKPKDTILWDLKEENLLAKGKVVKYLSTEKSPCLL